MVAILGESHLVGKVLEVLLQVAGYEARFFGAPDADGLGEALADARLVVLSPASGIKYAAIDGILAAGMPVLKLIRDGDEEGEPPDAVVPWPCRLEYLGERIEAALRPATGDRV